MNYIKQLTDGQDIIFELTQSDIDSGNPSPINLT